MPRMTTTVPAPGYGPALWNAVKSFALLRESIVGMIGAGLVLFWVILALGAPLFSPCDPNATLQPFAKPGTPVPIAGACWTDTFVLGADNIGRDVLSRIVWGARTVLTWAPVAAVSAYLVGIVLGLAAGYYRGWIDDVLSGISNIILAFPVLVLYILIIAAIGASPLNIVFAVTFATGLPPPDPDWGGMINETRQMSLAFPHMTVMPCIAISSLILGFNLLADGLREISLRD